MGGGERGFCDELLVDSEGAEEGAEVVGGEVEGGVGWPSARKLKFPGTVVVEGIVK